MMPLSAQNVQAERGKIPQPLQGGQPKESKIPRPLQGGQPKESNIPQPLQGGQPKENKILRSLQDSQPFNPKMLKFIGSLEGALAEMEDRLTDFSIPGVPQLEEELKRLILAGGKRLRPCLTWVSWQFGEDPKLPVLPLMCMIEWMHTASLIHDDVVDDAPVRRGIPTLQTQLGREAALAGGDYLLGIAMKELHHYRGTGINEVLADVATQMCSGEFSQMRDLYRTDRQSIRSYETRIRRKTAYLIAASCYTGGRAGGLSDTQTAALRAYGERIGTAFQLKDDILDYTADASFGKKRGQDLNGGIFTLPILYAFSNTPDPAMYEMAQKREKTAKDTETLIAYVKEAGGIAYTEQRIADLSREAMQCLKDLPEGVCSQAFEMIALALGKRKN